VWGRDSLPWSSLLGLLPPGLRVDCLILLQGTIAKPRAGGWVRLDWKQRGLCQQSFLEEEPHAGMQKCWGGGRVVPR
jgi:hypothetical protein